MKNDKQKVSEKLRQISVKGGDIADTIAEQLRREGKNQSLKKVAVKMIQQGLDNETIANCTDLSIIQIELLRDLEN